MNILSSAVDLHHGNQMLRKGSIPATDVIAFQSSNLIGWVRVSWGWFRVKSKFIRITPRLHTEDTQEDTRIEYTH